MYKESKVKKKHLALKIICPIILLLVILIYCIFSKAGMKTYSKNSELKDVIHKFDIVSDKGGSTSLCENDVNEILNLVVGKGITKKNITIKKSWVDISNDNVTVYALAKYKNFELLLSSIGKITYNENLVYRPEKFKVGKITIPKSIALNNVQKLLKNKIVIEDENIIVKKDNIPLHIDNVKCENGNVIVCIKKSIKSQILDKVNTELASIAKNTKDNSKKQKISDMQNKIKTMKDEIQKKQNNNNSKQVSKNVNSNNKNIAKNSSTKAKGSASKAISELSAARGSISSGKGKQMVDIMISTINQLNSNPSSNCRGNVGAVVSIYKSLTPQQKKNFKNALFTNVDTANALKLKSYFKI
ncbi:hypothetical protein [Haloimpatiens myeolchijeotgali]|uniref:hypothetical protein n=1 Tax=Haloimpatiens sp. FM7330 TaxID=3298610 RepID=UPI0038503461